MSDTNERAGSVASEPTGWAVVNRHGTAVRFSGSFLTLATAATQADEIVPLYRSPTLTDAEREALERICEAADDIIDEDKRANGVHWQDDAAAVSVVRGLLERTKT